MNAPTDFGFTEEHDVLRDGARRFLEARCPIDAVRRMAADPLGHDPALWKDMAELGWAGLMVDEEHGGAGLGYLHQALLLEETGRRVLPSPLLATTFAAIALQRAGDADQQARWLPAIASGEAIGTLALTEPRASWEPTDVDAVAERDGDGWTLSGEKTHVLSLSHADFVVAPFRCDGDVSLFIVDTGVAGTTARAEVGVDPTRRTGRLCFDGVRVDDTARLARGDVTALDDIHTRATALLSAEMVGGAESALLMTRDYAIDRKQFNKQIGAFQAIKHPLVEIMIGVEQSRSLAYAAAAALDQPGSSGATLARMAKALVSDVFWYATDRGIQFHGGFGFTIDCDMHFYFKRAIWCRAMLGDAPHHRRHLADELLDR